MVKKGLRHLSMVLESCAGLSRSLTIWVGGEGSWQASRRLEPRTKSHCSGEKEEGQIPPRGEEVPEGCWKSSSAKYPIHLNAPKIKICLSILRPCCFSIGVSTKGLRRYNSVVKLMKPRSRKVGFYPAKYTIFRISTTALHQFPQHHVCRVGC